MRDSWCQPGQRWWPPSASPASPSFSSRWQPAPLGTRRVGWRECAPFNGTAKRKRSRGRLLCGRRADRARPRGDAALSWQRGEQPRLPAYACPRPTRKRSEPPTSLVPLQLRDPRAYVRRAESLIALAGTAEGRGQEVKPGVPAMPVLSGSLSGGVAIAIRAAARVDDSQYLRTVALVEEAVGIGLSVVMGPRRGRLHPGHRWRNSGGGGSDHLPECAAGPIGSHISCKHHL